jgi:hypothetical protein
MLLLGSVKSLNPAQLKSLADFSNTVAAAWFTAGVISPVFTKPKSFLELMTLLSVSLLMTWATLRWSLFLLDGVKELSNGILRTLIILQPSLPVCS